MALVDIIEERRKGGKVAQILDIPYENLAALQGIGERVKEIRYDGDEIIIIARKNP